MFYVKNECIETPPKNKVDILHAHALQLQTDIRHWLDFEKQNKLANQHILPPRAVQNSVRKGPPYKIAGSSQVITYMCSSRRISSLEISLPIAMRLTAAPSLGSLTICIYKSLGNGLGLIVVFLVPHLQTRGVHEILISPIGVVDRVE